MYPGPWVLGAAGELVSASIRPKQFACHATLHAPDEAQQHQSPDQSCGFGGTADDAMLPFQKWLFAERQQSRVVRGCSEITKPSHSQSVEAPSGDTSRCMCVTCMQSHKFAWRVARRQLLVVFCRSTVAGLGFTNAPGPLPAPPRSPPRSSLTTNSHSHTTTKGWADGRLGL